LPQSSSVYWVRLAMISSKRHQASSTLSHDYLSTRKTIINGKRCFSQPSLKPGHPRSTIIIDAPVLNSVYYKTQEKNMQR
jgi:hypothetical protein